MMMTNIQFCYLQNEQAPSLKVEEVKAKETKIEEKVQNNIGSKTEASKEQLTDKAQPPTLMTRRQLLDPFGSDDEDETNKDINQVPEIPKSAQVSPFRSFVSDVSAPNFICFFLLFFV